MRAESTIRWLLSIVFISLTGVTLFGATNFYDNPSTKAEIKVDSSVKSVSKFVSGSIEKSALFDSLVDKEISIVIAIISMIEDKGIIPTSINELKTNKYLVSNFNEENLISNGSKKISFKVLDNIIEIDTNINSNDEVTIAERDYYINNSYKGNSSNSISNIVIDKKQFVDSSTNTLKTNYYINRKSLNILGAKSSNNINHTSKFIGNQEPSTYSSVNNSNVWFDSNVKEFDVKQRINNKWSDTTSSNKNLREDGTFFSPKTLPITAVIKNFTNVNITEEQKVIECRTAGATYNQVLNRCEAFTSDACDGNFYDLATDKCYIKPLDYCKANGFDGYDSDSNRCWKYVYSGKTDYSCGCGWVLGRAYQVLGNFFFYTSQSARDNHKLLTLNGGWIFAELYIPCGKNDFMGNFESPYNPPFYYTVSQKGTYPTPTDRMCHYSCPTTHPTDMGNGQCRGVQYANHISNINSYTFLNNGMNGIDAYIKNPSCSGKSSSMGGGVSTPIYGNNGVCYSDIAMYCKTHASDINPYVTLSNGRVINCWDDKQTCNDTRFGLVTNYSGNSDKCSKFNYSCNNITRYGLAESPHPQNILPNPYVGANGFDNPTVLFDRITDKFNKTLIPSNLDKIVAKQDILINDNNGSMCVENIESNYLPTSKDYIIDSKTKSGF